MKIKPLFLIALLSFSFSRLYAQIKALPQPLSLQQAETIALKNNPDLQVRSLNTAIAQTQAEQARRAKIPNIYGSYNLRRNLIIPQTPVPSKAFDPNAQPGEITYLQFSTKWTSNAGINMQWDIFNPENQGTIKEAQKKVAISAMDHEISANNLKFTIGQDYAACVIAKKQLELAIADTMSKQKIEEMVSSQYKAGRLKITDLNQIIAQKIQAISNYYNSKKILVTAKAQLLNDMGFSPEELNNLRLSDSLQGLLKNIQFPMFQNNRSSLSLEELTQQNELTQIQLSAAKKGFLPTVSLKGFYGADYYDNNFDQFKGAKWFGDSYLGLSINIPISRGLSSLKNIAALRLQREANQSNYKALENKISLEKFNAFQDLKTKEKILQQKQEYSRLAKENFEAVTAQFHQGRLLIGDWLTSDYQYRQAMTDYLKAAYDYLLAQMTLKQVSLE